MELIYLIGVALFVFATLDLMNRYNLGQSYRKLKKMRKKNTITEEILKECSHFYEVQQWHIAAYVVSFTCLVLYLRELL
tara:strand:+ start:187 stop:423 length:237 start_codon:yes stop_codon:yes gene_type:complete